jgi:hypothetical protein
MPPIRNLQEGAVVARRTPNLVPVARSLSTAERAELQQLFELMADTCDAAGMVLETGSELQRLRELTERVDSMLGLTKTILE